MALTAGNNVFGLTVAEEPEEVAKALGAGGMSRLTKRWVGDESSIAGTASSSIGESTT
jgi:hypothetical protein